MGYLHDLICSMKGTGPHQHCDLLAHIENVRGLVEVLFDRYHTRLRIACAGMNGAVDVLGRLDRRHFL